MADALFAVLPELAFGEAAFDLNQELKLLQRGEVLPLRIPGAKYRVAVFSYEDPDGTGIGDALASIVGRQILLRFESSSIGVLNYQGRLAPTEADPLSYFDKVEKLAEAQHVTMSVWGMVRRNGPTLAIDTYVQLPPRIIEKTFVWRVRLPKSMGGELIAHLSPERILAQSLEVPAETAVAFRTEARRLEELRSEPSDSVAATGLLPKGSVYWVEKDQGDLIFVNAGAKGSGWVRRVRILCVGDCAPLVDAGDFGAAMLAFMEQPGANEFSGSLSPDADAIRDQLEVLELLNRGTAEELSAAAARIAGRVRAGAAGGTVPPGGAALANVSMIDYLVSFLRSEARRGASKASSGRIESVYDGLVPDRERVRALAFDLAESSLADPGNIDVLHNLAILFAYAGDEQRATLARSLANR